MSVVISISFPRLSQKNMVLIKNKKCNGHLLFFFRCLTTSSAASALPAEWNPHWNRIKYTTIITQSTRQSAPDNASTKFPATQASRCTIFTGRRSIHKFLVRFSKALQNLIKTMFVDSKKASTSWFYQELIIGRVPLLENAYLLRGFITYVKVVKDLLYPNSCFS